MNVLWTRLALGILGVISTTIARLRERRQTDLGFVSHHWVGEHRMAQAQDSQR